MQPDSANKRVIHEISTPDEFRDLIEARRQDVGMAHRNVSLSAGAAHGTYWAWHKGDAGRITLTHALAYAKALGVRVLIEIPE